MKAFKHTAIKLLFLFVVPIVVVIASTGAKSAAELPPALCQDDSGDDAAGKSAPQNAPVVNQKPAPRNLAILIFDGVQIIDYTGPYETFGHAYSNDGPVFNIYTVSEKADAITTAMGMTVTPKYSFENAPQPSVLLVPGGGVNEQVANPKVIKWIQDKAKDAEIVMSVCNGAFILAKAGLLDGLEATTTSGLIPSLREAAPKTKVVDDRRYVDNGKIITTADSLQE